MPIDLGCCFSNLIFAIEPVDDRGQWFNLVNGTNTLPGRPDVFPGFDFVLRAAQIHTIFGNESIGVLTGSNDTLPQVISISA